MKHKPKVSRYFCTRQCLARPLRLVTAFSLKQDRSFFARLFTNLLRVFEFFVDWLVTLKTFGIIACLKNWHKRKELKKSSSFSADDYLLQNPDVCLALLDPYFHYIFRGTDEGRRPGADNPATSPGMESASADRAFHLRIRARAVHETFSFHLAARLGLAGISFPPCREPRLSVIILYSGEPAQTLRCLASLRESFSRNSAFEVLVAAERGDKDWPACFNNLSGVAFFDGPGKPAPGAGIDEAASAAVGEYIVFLSDSCLVFPDCLDRLLDSFAGNKNVGLTLPMVLRPDGSLLSAARPASVFEDPCMPRHNYVRDTSYFSGHCFMCRQTHWRKFAVLATTPTSQIPGLKSSDKKLALYQPKARVISDIDCRPQADQATDKRPMKVLVVDQQTPTPDRDAGSVVVKSLMLSLVKKGADLAFAPASDMLFFGEYSECLQQAGIQCLYRPYVNSVQEYLSREGKTLDLVILVRFPTASELFDDVLRFAPGAKVVFDTVDLHFLRNEREAAVTGEATEQAAILRKNELNLIKRSDLALLRSPYENELLRSIDPLLKTFVLPVCYPEGNEPAGFSQRHDILFIGGFQHRPNKDAADFFINEIWPLIAERLPECNFILAGADSDELPEKASNDNRIKSPGRVRDLNALIGRCRLSVAPIRFGAGIKGKVIKSISQRLPCVCTSIAAEGTGLRKGQDILVADQPKEFADAVAELYNDEKLWNRLSGNAFKVFQKRYSDKIHDSKVDQFLKQLGLDIRKSRK